MKPTNISYSSVNRARERLGNYPKIFSACIPEGIEYAKCVSASSQSVTQKLCEQQFQIFFNCLKKAGKGRL